MEIIPQRYLFLHPDARLEAASPGREGLFFGRAILMYEDIHLAVSLLRGADIEHQVLCPVCNKKLMAPWIFLKFRNHPEDKVIEFCYCINFFGHFYTYKYLPTPAPLRGGDYSHLNTLPRVTHPFIPSRKETFS
jgi:hypothetical protein